MPKIIRVGTRGSELALAQTQIIISALKIKNPQTTFKLVTIRSEGDRDQTFGLFKSGQVGVFTKALEDSLLKNKIDIAVHSLKDLPTTLHKKLAIGCYPKRESACDVLVSSKKWSLRTLPAGAVVGTGSPRRKRQLLKLRPDLTLVDLRGNLDTRVQKALKRDGFDAVLVAEAGLNRIRKYQKFSQRLNPEIFLPAVGQGALALEIRKNDAASEAIVKKINHAPTEVSVSAERAFLKELRGGCRVPVGVHTRLTGSRLTIRAAVFSVKNDSVVFGRCSAKVSGCAESAKLLAKKLLKMGARGFLSEARR